jgi:hypothetical protein
MTVYQARMDTIYYSDDPASEGAPCELRIDGDEIVVSTGTGADTVVYEGRQLSEGHFHLRSSDPEGTATLHCFEKSRIFEGYWAEKDGPDYEGGRGFWRITIDIDG